MTTPRHMNRFLQDDQASMTVEFVVVMGAFITIAFLAIEIALAFFWWKTAEKATQLGVRLAAVSTPVASGIPATNVAVGGAFNGTRCANASGTDAGTCVNFATVSCGGGGAACSNAAERDRIIGRMKNILNIITPANVRFQYQYVSMGYVGGATVPLVTVTLTNVPFNTGFLSMLGNGISCSGTKASACSLHVRAISKIPDISARVTGEDLSTPAPG